MSYKHRKKNTKIESHIENNERITMKTEYKTKDMVLIALFAVMISICAWISIPTTVPFTMQTFGVFLAFDVLGGKRGTFSVMVYLLLGIAGIPVFAGGMSGIGIVFGKTGGYMLGWLAAGFIIWIAERLFGRKKRVLILSSILGLLMCYIVGTFWFMTVYAGTMEEISVGTAFAWCVVPFVVPDLFKIFLALSVQKRLMPFIN